jgi:hypothetical protein
MASLKRHHACGRTLVFLALFAAAACAAQTPPPAAGNGRVPVLIELFTSEGCSDCPPADRLLEEIDTRQPIPGVQAIVLSEHVTYWNHQGWTDPFSLDDIDMRQKDYGDEFKLESVYTPQAVVDGSAQMVGSRGPDLAKAIEHAAATPKQPLTIADAHWDNGNVSFSVHAAPQSGSRLVAALAADATGPKVTAGENQGRTLHHVAVVRTIKEFNAGAVDGRVLKLSGGSLAKQAAPSPVRLVVFLVEKKSGHVTSVAEQNLSR